jgi:uncharacterized protein YukJ
MPLKDYGVLVARAVDQHREGAGDSPHFQIHVVDDAGIDFRIAVNVMSQQSPSELLYLVDDQFAHPILGLLPPSGWTSLPAHPGGPGLDFIRGNLFDHTRMQLLPPDVSGPDNDLADLLGLHVTRAINDPDARLYIFGERWGPEATTADKIFGFLPGNGVHDIHMNQGNSPGFAGDDGVWQDGGLLLHFPSRGQWVGIFLAFQSQAWHTDDTTGHTIPGVTPPPGPIGEAAPRVRIVGALVNPAGPAPEAETVTLLNASADTVDLTGWRISDRMKRSAPVVTAGQAALLPAGGTLVVRLTGDAALSNSGGTITLLDQAGLKVDGVSYTKSQATTEGWTVVF